MSLKSEYQGQLFEMTLSKASLKFWMIISILLPLILLILIWVDFSLLTVPLLVTLLIFSMSSFLAVAGLGLLLTRQISQRVNQIINAAEQVARGDLTIRVEDQRNDEIGQLVRAFNQMVSNLNQLHHSHDLLSRTMSPAVRHSLIEKGLDFRGITQTVSILFVDIRDFTRITERYNTEQLVFFLNDYYTTIANQVHSGGGIIGKYGGDSILAYFGAPTPEPPTKSATAALLTALALQDALEELSQRWMILGLPSIQVGIGISLGSVVAGPVGSEQQFEYTVIGDAVNLASRLQALTRNVPDYNIILSLETYHALEERVKHQIRVIDREVYEGLTPVDKARRPVQFVDLGEVLVKGKRGPVHVYGIPDCRVDRQNSWE